MRKQMIKVAQIPEELIILGDAIAVILAKDYLRKHKENKKGGIF
ncbi:MAG: hypothetical protein ABIE07_01470 [Candidatus Zixiibacteriota bacterium]